MLRKKYIFKKIFDEGTFLIEMYRSMDNKRGKGLGLKIDNFLKNKDKINQKIKDFVDSKSYDYRLQYNLY